MGDRPFLTRFPQVPTRRPDLFEAITPRYSVVDFEIRDPHAFEGQVNSFELGGLRLTYARYGSPIRLRIARTELFCQEFPISGAGEVVLGGHAVPVDSDRGGVAAGPGADAVLEYGPGYSHLAAGFSPEKVIRMLSVLLDQPVDPPLEIDGRSPYEPSVARSMARLVRFVADELDNVNGRLPPVLTQELEDGILVGYLLANRSNYSHLLHGASASIAPQQVERTIDFLEQHWQDPVTIELLANVAGTSARNLFHTFRRTQGISPMRYARRVRLRHARELLSAPGNRYTVSYVGYACGFGNLGYFAREYYRAFGEKPSATLARSQSPL